MLEVNWGIEIWKLETFRPFFRFCKITRIYLYKSKRILVGKHFRIDEQVKQHYIFIESIALSVLTFQLGKIKWFSPLRMNSFILFPRTFQIFLVVLRDIKFENMFSQWLCIEGWQIRSISKINIFIQFQFKTILRNIRIKLTIFHFNHI